MEELTTGSTFSLNARALFFAARKKSPNEIGVKGMDLRRPFVSQEGPQHSAGQLKRGFLLCRVAMNGLEENLIGIGLLSVQHRYGGSGTLLAV